MKRVFIIICLLFLLGCAILPSSETQTSKAGYVGDYDIASLGEIVVSVPTGMQEGQYENLHLRFAALINPKKPTIQSSYSVRDIVQRYSVRLSSIIVQDVLNYGRVSVMDLPALREGLVKKAQMEFEQMFAQWKNSDDFAVEIVLASIFFTEGNAEKIPNRE
jgi:hypothetical protein